MRFLSIGECMAEMSPAGDPRDPRAYRLDYAGDTYNTAWYFRRLRPDAGCAYLSAAGDDAPSDAMVSAIGSLVSAKKKLSPIKAEQTPRSTCRRTVPASGQLVRRASHNGIAMAVDRPARISAAE